MSFLHRWAALAVLLTAAVAHAASFPAVVTHVADGDSLWVRAAHSGERIEIRLLHLDAPEGCQRAGAEAKAALAQRVLHQPVAVHSRGRDDYGRTLARIEHRGTDIGGWLVAQGHAWSTGWRRSPGPYAAQQAEARRRHRGLWAQAKPQHPRDFRRQHGRCAH